MIDLTRYWWPLAQLTELVTDTPLARRLHGTPLVVFRDASGQPAILPDRCPHRHAPLSCGKVRAGELECPYHGWRFSGSGQCTAVPGLPLEPGAKPLVEALASRVEHGLIWACAAPDEHTPPPLAPAVEGDVDAFFMTDRVRCGLAEAAENFLDGFHTHFVHAGWIRRDDRRQTVTAQVRRLPDGLEARYSDEGLQSGLISTLFEGSRSESFGRFRLPGLAEIEYRGQHGLNLLITAWLTPEANGELRIHARIATQRGRLPAWLKQFVLRRLFAVILRQDTRILERTQANMTRFAKVGGLPPALDTELDLLGPGIRRLLAGETPENLPEREIRLNI